MSIYLGLMSGTSLDGIDVATLELGGEEERPEPAELVGFRTYPYDAEFRGRIEEACRRGSVRELSALNFELGRKFADAIRWALDADGREPGDVRAVGSHGQTVWHAPPGEGGHTLQLAEAAVIAEEIGLPVVSDFRVRDVAAGGHGAPLSPYFDRLLLGSPERSRAIQNLGGMGNVTLLPAEGEELDPIAFDTGPGVVLMDTAIGRLTDGSARFDRDGEVAAEGEVLEDALEVWLSDPFFRETPPRTTGRERFGPERLEEWLERFGGAAEEDLMATLTELTARTVAAALEMAELEVEEVYLCGGGARNPELVRRIEAHLAPTPAWPLETLGWEGDAREAAVFALLARQHLLGIPAAPHWATGAEGPRILGKFVPA